MGEGVGEKEAYDKKSFAVDVKQQYIFRPPIVLLLWQFLQDLGDLVLQIEQEEL